MTRRLSASLAAAGLLAGAALATGTAALAAAPASYAAEAAPVLVLGGPAEVALRPHPATGEPRATTVGVTVENPGAEERSGDYTVTFDLSGLAGVADVRFGETGSSHCTLTGTTGTCTDAFGIPPGLNEVAELEISAAPGSAPGATGTFEVTGASDGAAFAPYRAGVTVGGPDLVMHPLDLEHEVAPGRVQDAPLTFTNTGTAPADGVRLTLTASHGLDYTRRYANCAYEDSEDGAWTRTVCDFPGTYEPGATYTLAEPIGLRATGHAYTESFVHRVEERGGTVATRADGPRLTLRKAPAAARAQDLDPGDNQQESDLRVRNTADFAAYADVVTAPAGRTAEARVGFRNDGPAWIAHLRSGESVATVDVTVPAGATVTAKPAGCAARTAAGEYRAEPLGAPRYVCDTPVQVFEDEDFALPFELRIDRVVPGAQGAVTVRNGSPDRPALAFDPEPGNNTARLVLNPEGPGTDSTGGASTSGGTTSAGGTAATGGTSTSGAATGGATASGVTGGGAAGAGTGTSTAAGGGNLASTGSAAVPLAAGAAALTGAGAAAFLVARRRRPAQPRTHV
ncbi:peptidase [Streptomyces sp. NPDC015131]|uniref:peptidase n=1 Tax=Streptomyces sp. NPDC015131 TaxID=3364941 RepID=UPI0036F7058A